MSQRYRTITNKFYLRNHHKHFSSFVRKNFIAISVQISDGAEKNENVIFLSNIISLIKYLLIIPDVIKCFVRNEANEFCNFLCRGIKHIQNHCRNQHEWLNLLKKKQNKKHFNVDISEFGIEGVRCQRFNTHDLLICLFEIKKQDSDVRLLKTGFSQNFQNKRRLLLFNINTTKKNREEINRHTTVKADTNRFVPNAWLTRTGWAKHLQGLDQDGLASLISFSAFHETALTKLCFRVKRIIGFAQQASHAQIVNLAALNYINRREMNNDINEKSFNAGQIEKTMIKYCGHWTKIIRYVWRTHELQFIDVLSDDNHSYDEKKGQFNQYRPPYKLTIKQIMTLHRIRALFGENDEKFDS